MNNLKKVLDMAEYHRYLPSVVRGMQNFIEIDPIVSSDTIGEIY